MKDKYFLSIIIPVYNVEDYLDRCLTSIITQNYALCEIILVDDGSTDNSGNLCEQYVDKYHDIRVIHQKNGGLSKARNVGMSHAKGEYIMFLDSDDYLVADCIEKLISKIQSNRENVIVGKAKIIFLDGYQRDKVPYKLNEGVYLRDNYLKSLMKNRSYSACAPFSIYKREFLEKIGAKFYEGIIYEDELWTPSILLKTDRIYFSNEYFYVNCTRASSITQSSKSEKAVESLITVIEELDTLKRLTSPSFFDVFDENIVSLFLLAYCKSNCPQTIVAKFGRYYPIRRAHRMKTFLMALLYSLSPKSYLSIHKLVKGF